MMMRSLVATAEGAPLDRLRIETVPVPEAGPGQVRVRVQVAPVHFSDLHMIRGVYGVRPDFPMVPGLESVGVVDAVGPDVHGIAVGQRVVTAGVVGTWQDFVVVDQRQVLPVSEHLDTATAAQLLVSPLTAYLLATDELALHSGDWLVQTAAGSTVGQLVTQLSKVLGFHTINIVRRRSTAQQVIDLGGTETICSSDENVPERLAELTRGRSVLKAIDCVAGEVGAQVFEAIDPGGEMVVYGALSAHRTTEPERQVTSLQTRSLIYGSKSLRGFWLYSWFSTTPPHAVAAAIQQVQAMLADGGLRLPAGRPYALEDFGSAITATETPGREGKPLLVLEPSAIS